MLLADDRVRNDSPVDGPHAEGVGGQARQLEPTDQLQQSATLIRQPSPLAAQRLADALRQRFRQVLLGVGKHLADQRPGIRVVARFLGQSARNEGAELQSECGQRRVEPGAWPPRPLQFAETIVEPPQATVPRPRQHTLGPAKRFGACEPRFGISAQSTVHDRVCVRVSGDATLIVAGRRRSAATTTAG